jgi:hypothetical protein
VNAYEQALDYPEDDPDDPESQYREAYFAGMADGPPPATG